MIGHYVTINKSDYSQATGKVISVQDQKNFAQSYKGITGRNKCLGHNTR
jgi:hypothetical protein